MLKFVRNDLGFEIKLNFPIYEILWHFQQKKKLNVST